MAVLNILMWVMSIIALVLILRHSPGAKGLIVILMGGQSISIMLYSNITKFLNG